MLFPGLDASSLAKWSGNNEVEEAGEYVRVEWRKDDGPNLVGRNVFGCGGSDGLSRGGRLSLLAVEGAEDAVFVVEELLRLLLLTLTSSPATEVLCEVTGPPENTGSCLRTTLRGGVSVSSDLLAGGEGISSFGTTDEGLASAVFMGSLALITGGGCDSSSLRCSKLTKPVGDK